MPKKSRTNALIDRSVDDENFVPTVGLVGMCAAWSEQITEGQCIAHNDRNMIQIPAEIAIAFMKLHASDQSPLGGACRQGLENLQSFRAAAKSDALL